MTYTDAVAIRVRALNGKPVDQAQLAEAISIIQTTRPVVKKRRAKVQVDLSNPAPLEIPVFLEGGKS